MTVEFNTREYQFSHGHGPRGRGAWAFYFSREEERRGAACAWWAPMGSTYQEAKHFARVEARRRGSSEVFVGS